MGMASNKKSFWLSSDFTRILHPSRADSTLAEAEDDSACDLKIVERFAGSHDSSRNTGHIAERPLITADLVAHVEAKSEPLCEEKLQAAAKVSRECGLAAVGPCFHQIRIKWSGLAVVAQSDLASSSANAGRYIRHPSATERREVVNVVGRCGKGIGDAELDGIVISEVVEHPAADGSSCFYL